MVDTEKDRAREERVRIREEEQAQRELAREREKLEKEQSHYIADLEAMRANGDAAAIAEAEAEAQLAEITAAMDDVGRRSANTRAGYVYVISNVGSFGNNIVKIGMTRRLEPHDRIRELGDASVPFLYDTHALIFSEDAIGLETSLHQAFEAQKVNIVNQRREFFYATPAQVRDMLQQFDSAALLSFNEEPEALEWRQSENVRRGVV